MDKTLKTYTLVLNSILTFLILFSITMLIGTMLKKTSLEVDFPVFCHWFRILHTPVDAMLVYYFYKWMVKTNVINKRPQEGA